MADKRPDPMIEALAALSRPSISRRRVLRAAAAGGAAVAGAPLLAACGSKPAGNAGANPSNQSAPDKSDTDKVVNFSNWQSYMDVGKNSSVHPTLDAFTAKTGVKVDYVEDITDNAEFFAKVSPALRAGQDTGRDLFALTDWMAARFIRLGYVQKIDKANTPNVVANMQATLASPSWDPDRSHSAPWQSGFTGIAYNSKVVPEVRTITELLTRPDLKGKVDVLTEMRDTIGLIMLDQGKNPTQFTDDDYYAAIDVLQKAVDSKQIRNFTGNEYTKPLSSGDIRACIAWSGDVVQLQPDNPDVKFVAPEAGLMIWSDNMMIPNLAQHKKNAELVMNWYYDPEVAAKLTAYIQYVAPVKGTQEAMTKVDKSLVNNPLIFPDAATLARTHLFMGLDEKQEKAYQLAFDKVSGA